MNLALKYFSMFLPTNSELDPAKGYKLWFKPLMSYWETFANFPAWENDLFRVSSVILIIFGSFE